MKRYFIKLIYTATAGNPGFKAGTKHEYWYGRQETLIAKFYLNEPAPSPALIAYQMKDYGFKNKAGAMKAFKYHKQAAQGESDFGYWNCACSVGRRRLKNKAQKCQVKIRIVIIYEGRQDGTELLSIVSTGIES